MTISAKQYDGVSGVIAGHDEHTQEGTIGAGAIGGVGFAIVWQNGPRGQGPDGRPGTANGAQVEDVLLACHSRLKAFEGQAHDTEHNALARDLVSAAIRSLRMRRADRAARGVEGTQEV